MSREKRVQEIQGKNGSEFKKALRFPSNNWTCQSYTLLTQLVQNVNVSDRRKVRELQADNNRIRQRWGIRKEDGWMMDVSLISFCFFGVRLGFPPGENVLPSVTSGWTTAVGHGWPSSRFYIHQWYFYHPVGWAASNTSLCQSVHMNIDKKNLKPIHCL